MTNNIIHWVKPLTSLKLTVFCFACAMILVFLGTLDQVNIGVYEAENRYFKSFFLYFTPPGTTLKIPWFPSGYLVGGLLLVNLIAAHLARFKFTWKKAGILVLHSGVILLTILQVVQNPSWLIPYISCALIAFGMVIQFGMHLTSFVRRRVIS
jgi:hypothetical protein